jgi:hypothetical protein
MSMAHHIRNLCVGTYIQLRDVRAMRPFLTPDALLMITHALITSRLDYCNALLTGIAQSHIQLLQRAQNAAAKMVTKSKKYDHVTPILHKLHWLPISYRIQYKVLLTTYKALNGKTPNYITELLQSYKPTRSLRSSHSQQLVVPYTRLRSFGDRAFCAVSPKLWNALPQSLKNIPTVESFKTRLKAHLFQSAFLGRSD